MGKLRIEMLGTSFTIQANEDTAYLEKLLGYYKRITDDVGGIDSIKNPKSGVIKCLGVKEVINEDSIMESNYELIIK